MSRRKALAPCSVKGCPTLSRQNQCEAHRKAAEARRGSSSDRGYGTTWAKFRRKFMTDHPHCQDKAGCIAPSTDCHHVDGLGPLGPRGYDPSNCLALCSAHHARITAAEQPGGWNQRD